MQALIDHAAAVVIGAAILFMLFALNTRSNDSTVEATQVDLAKTELRLLVDLMEQDFTNMGSGLPNPNTSAATSVITSYSTVSGYDVLEFSGLQNDTGTPDPVVFTYRWRQQGTAALPDGSTVNTFEVERSTAGGPTTHLDKVTGFSLTLRDEDLAMVPLGSTTDELALVRYLDVAFGMVPPIGIEALLQQTRWAKRFRPINLDPTRRLIASPP